MTKSYYALKLSLFPTIIFSIIFLISSSNNKLATAFVTDDDSNLVMFRGDLIRQRMILHKQSLIKKHQRLHSISGYIRRELVEETNNSGENVFVKLPMQSGADFGIGQYLVSFKAGTPSQKFSLILDTGSDLTWMNCKYGCQQDLSKCSSSSSSSSSKASVFEADDSSSFSTILCSSDMCKVELANLFSLAICPSPRTPCAYDYRYSDGSSAVGFFANETITVGLTNGRKEKLENVLIGCSQSSQGPSFHGQVPPQGVLGLGFSKTSFATKATEAFGGKFSYCLSDHLSPENVSNYLTFSSATYHTTSNNMIFTTLGAIGSFYAVNIRSLSIGGQILNIPGEIWDVNGVGGAIIDSGSSLTYLTLPAYQPVMSALTASLLKFQRINIKNELFKYCFNATEFTDVPRLVFHFQDGARFEPPVKSYVIDVAEGVKCIGLVPAAWPGVSVIGNIMQQNHLWEFDFVNGKLGFTSSSCS